MKRLLTLILTTLFFCLAYTGCYLDDFTSSEQDKLLDLGAKIFKEYLIKTQPGAKIKEISAIKYLGENRKMQLTEFVEGKYQTDSKKVQFAVNTKTGEIYTSEQTDPFKKKITALINEMLGLHWTAVKPDIHVASCVILHGKRAPLNSDRGELQEVLPVNITDMNAFVKDSLKNENLSLSMQFIYTGPPLHPQATIRTAAENWKHVSIELQRFPDALQKEIKAANHEAWGSNRQWPVNEYAALAEETLTIRRTPQTSVSTYQQWQNYKNTPPFTIHYPAYTLESVWTEHNSQKEQENYFDIENDMLIKQHGKQYEFVTKDNRQVRYYVFLDNLTAADNVKEIAMRNRKLHDAAFNEGRWHPVLGRWCIGSKAETVNQLYAMEANDLIIIGNEALNKLQPKKKVAEAEKGQAQTKDITSN